MNKILLDNLTKFGMSEKEAITYGALFELGVASTQAVSDLTGLRRSTTYAVLSTLREKKFVKEIDKMKVRAYEAVSPDVLLGQARKTFEHYRKSENELMQIMPQLRTLSESSPILPRVDFYEHRDGIEIVVSDIKRLTKKDTLRMFGLVDEGFKLFISLEKSKVLRGQMKILAPWHNKVGHMPSGIKAVALRLVPAEQYSYATEICIYGNKVAVTSKEEDFCILIESKDTAAGMREIFDLAWEEAGRLDRDIRRSLSAGKGKGNVGR